jgi:hypothetical protein
MLASVGEYLLASLLCQHVLFWKRVLIFAELLTLVIPLIVQR